jgi:carbon-monoxide dehydrogenase large subunit
MGATDQGVIGQSVRRKEDVRFLTGAGQFTDDVTYPHQTCGYFLRSPHAHAKIRKIDTAKGKAAPGVVAIFTGEDLTGVNGLPCGWLITGTDGKPMNEPPHPVLAQGKVRHVGDRSRWSLRRRCIRQRRGRTDRRLQCSLQSSTVDAETGAPQIHEQADNKCYTWAWRRGGGRRPSPSGDQSSKRHHQQPSHSQCHRAARRVASYSRADGHTRCMWLTESARRAAADDRVRAGLPIESARDRADVGRLRFKIYLYAEETRSFGRQESESPDQVGADAAAFLTDARPATVTRRAGARQGRQVPGAAMQTTANMGAYLSTFAAAFRYGYADAAGRPVHDAAILRGDRIFLTAPVDRIAAQAVEPRTWWTDRSPGRRRHRIAQDEIRRRNFIRTFPYATPVALTYDIATTPRSTTR